MRVINTTVHDRSKLLVTLDEETKYFSHFLLQVINTYVEVLIVQAFISPDNLDVFVILIYLFT